MSYKYDHTYRYVLMEAICNDRVEEVKKVLDLDFDPKRIVCPERGLDAVNLASMLHRPHILKYLLLRGGSLEGRDKEGNTPLMNAVRNWQFENLKILVEGGSDIEAVDQFGKDSIAKANDLSLKSMANYLISKRDDPNRSKKMPDFQLKMKLEDHFDGEKDVLLKKPMFLKQGVSYPFNSLTESYIIDMVTPVDINLI